MEVGPLDIAVAVVASRKFLSSVCCLGEGSFVTGGSLQLECPTQTAVFADLMQVTIKTSGAPQLFWTYLDEGWNVWLAQISRPCGGRSVPSTIALKLLQRFRAYMDKLMWPNLCAFLLHIGLA